MKNGLHGVSWVSTDRDEDRYLNSLDGSKIEIPQKVRDAFNKKRGLPKYVTDDFVGRHFANSEQEVIDITKERKKNPKSDLLKSHKYTPSVGHSIIRVSKDSQGKDSYYVDGEKIDIDEDYCDMFGCESGFFTRDDLNELMDEINDRCPQGVQATAIYMGDDQKTLEVDMEDDEYGSETVYKKIDMRKIRKPSDLLRYANSIIADFQNTVGKWEVGNEE